MDQQRICQPQCWLGLAIEAGIEPPKYRLYQEIRLVWFSDEVGVNVVDRGVIKGIFLDNPGAFISTGWWYVVDWLDSTLSDTPPGFRNEVHETEIAD